MIHIDFQGGAHGNYLEFVCNKFLGNVPTVGDPFNSLGASHNKQYLGNRIFYADHYSFLPRPFVFDKIISIQISKDDLLPFQQISLLRAGDYNYDNDQLEIDTYNKLHNENYGWTLNNIMQNFFVNQIRDSFNTIKDPSWPEIYTIKDFNNLPDWIKKECINHHKLELLELSPDRPDCPRSILREFFQIGFQLPEQHGFIVRQEQAKYDESKHVYYFPFTCFYDKNSFLQEVKKIAKWLKISYAGQHDIDQLHDKFLARQPYKHSKIKCGNIITQIQNNKPDLPNVDLLEEAYINAKLGQNYFI